MQSNAEFELVFDLAEVGYRQWGYTAFGLVAVACSIGLYFLGRSALKTSFPIFRSTLPKVGLVVSILFTLVAFLPTYVPYHKLRSAYDGGQAVTVEGMVTNFSAENTSQKQPETFEVEGQAFRYSMYLLTPGFNQSRPLGGPLKEGVHVRIAHVDGAIVKLEIAR